MGRSYDAIEEKLGGTTSYLEVTGHRSLHTPVRSPEASRRGRMGGY
jgi:hypothetical protein